VSVERRDSFQRDDNYNRNSPGEQGEYRDDRAPRPGSRSPRRSGSPQSKGRVLYVGNLSRTFTENELRERFARFGKIESVQLIKDPNTGDCRGFGFVEYSQEDEATEAVKELDQQEFDGRKLRVEKSKRGVGYQRTPGRYLGHSSRRTYHDRGGGGGGYSPRRRYHERDRSRDRERSRERYYRDRSPRYRRYSRSPSPRERDYRRGGGYVDDRRYRDHGVRRDRSFSRDRYDDYRYRDRSRERR